MPTPNTKRIKKIGEDESQQPAKSTTRSNGSSSKRSISIPQLGTLKSETKKIVKKISRDDIEESPSPKARPNRARPLASKAGVTRNGQRIYKCGGKLSKRGL